MPPFITSTTTPEVSAGRGCRRTRTGPSRRCASPLNERVLNLLRESGARRRRSPWRRCARCRRPGPRTGRQVAVVLLLEGGDEGLVGRSVLPTNHGLPTRVPSAAVPAMSPSLGEFRPLPPMKNTLGRCRAGAPAARCPRPPRPARQHDRVGVERLDLGELGREVGILRAEGLGGEDLDAELLQRRLHDVVGRLGEGVVIAVHHGDALDAELLLRGLERDRDHVGFRQRRAEDVGTDRRDAVGGGRGADDPAPCARWRPGGGETSRSTGSARGSAEPCRGRSACGRRSAPAPSSRRNPRR